MQFQSKTPGRAVLVSFDSASVLFDTEGNMMPTNMSKFKYENDKYGKSVYCYYSLFPGN